MIPPLNINIKGPRFLFLSSCALSCALTSLYLWPFNRKSVPSVKSASFCPLSIMKISRLVIYAGTWHHDYMIVLQRGVTEMFLIRVLRELREGKKKSLCSTRVGMFRWPLKNAQRSTQTGQCDTPRRLFLITSNFTMKGQGKHSHKASLIDVSWRGSALETLNRIETVRVCVCARALWSVISGWVQLFESACSCLCVSVSNWPDVVCVYQPRGGKLLDWPLLCDNAPVWGNLRTQTPAATETQ